MAEVIINGSGVQYPLVVNSDGSINVNSVDDTFENPFQRLIYISSGTNTGITAGSCIGSIVKFTGAGSKVKVLGYVNDNLVNVGSWA
jgi:hypothetical protein